MAEHTPGPWELHENEDGDFEIHMGTRIGAFNSWQTQHVVEMRHSLDPDDGEQYDEALATATLIAAAPDLLAALAGLIAEIGAEWPDEWSALVYEDAVAALRKAGGD